MMNYLKDYGHRLYYPGILSNNKDTNKERGEIISSLEMAGWTVITAQGLCRSLPKDDFKQQMAYRTLVLAGCEAIFCVQADDSSEQMWEKIAVAEMQEAHELGLRFVEDVCECPLD